MRAKNRLIRRPDHTCILPNVYIYESQRTNRCIGIWNCNFFFFIKQKKTYVGQKNKLIESCAYRISEPNASLNLAGTVTTCHMRLPHVVSHTLRFKRMNFFVCFVDFDFCFSIFLLPLFYRSEFSAQFVFAFRSMSVIEFSFAHSTKTPSAQLDFFLSFCYCKHFDLRY